MRAEQFTDPLAEHGEGPVWSPSWSGLKWVDMLRGDVLTYDSRHSSISRRHVGSVAAIVRPRASGGLVVATERSVLTSDTTDGPLTEMREMWSDASVRMNDGGCDPEGNFWFGSMAYDATPHRAALYRLTPDGTVRVVLAGVTISNGLDWSPDGARAYYVDSPTGRIDELDLAEGTLANRRVFAEVSADGGLPDGLCVDSEGYVWVAIWDGGAVHRYSPRGALDEIVELPVPKVSACTFGGENLDELFITTSRQGDTDGSAGPAGSVYRVQVGIAGQPVRTFAG